VADQYSENARRAIFTARIEACEFNSTYVETEHLLLGLLRTSGALARKFSDSGFPVESIRGQLLPPRFVRHRVSRSPDVSHSLDLLLSDEVNRVLLFASEEAERLGHRYIGTDHLTLGILREENCVAARFFKQADISFDEIRANI
jgi:ATP-dependent Clp protease ATP-binding subunit ClpC